MDNNYTIKDFKKQFPNDDKCLDHLFLHLFKSFDCSCGGKYYKRSSRRVYTCSKCSKEICPTANTIFHKSRTPLTLWFFAIFLISKSKNGVSSKELQRLLGVTYKTAYRINAQIRKLFDNDDDDDENGKLKGIIEMDEAFHGGEINDGGKGGRANKSLIIGMLERAGNVIARVVGNTKGSTVLPLIEKNIEKKSKIITDDAAVYSFIISPTEYSHESVNHSKKEYARGDAHVNNLEGFWSQLKRAISGTYHSLSPKHLQTYINQFAFYYNNRKEKNVFGVMLERV